MIFDIETNGLKLDEISVVWCICAIDRGRRAAAVRSSGDPRGSRVCSRPPIGSSVTISASYDLPVLERVYGFRYAGKVVDTLVLSRLLCNGLSQRRTGTVGTRSRRGDRGSVSRKASTPTSPGTRRRCSNTASATARSPSGSSHYFRPMKPSKAAVELELAIRSLSSVASSDTDSRSTPRRRARSRAKIERRLERLQGLLDGIFPPTRPRPAGEQYYTYEPSKRSALRRSDFPKCPTKTELETWRKQHKIRPRDGPARRGTAGRQDGRFNASSPASSDSGTAVARLGAGRGERVRIDQDERDRALPLGTPRRSSDCGYRGFAKLRSFTEAMALACSRRKALSRRFSATKRRPVDRVAESPNIQQIPTAKKRKSGLRVLVPTVDGADRSSDRNPDTCSSVAISKGSRSGSSLTASHRTTEATSLVGVASGEDLHQAERRSPRDTARDREDGPLRVACTGSVPELSRSISGSPETTAQVVIDGFTCGLPGFASLQVAPDHRVPTRQTYRARSTVDGSRSRESTRCLVYAISGDAAILMKHWALAVEQATRGHVLPDARGRARRDPRRVLDRSDAPASDRDAQADRYRRRRGSRVPSTDRGRRDGGEQLERNTLANDGLSAHECFESWREGTQRNTSEHQN